MIRKTQDAAFLNRVANHPEVRPWLGADAMGDNESLIDFSPLLACGAAYALVEDECGGFLVVRLSDDEDWECHTMFLPEKRGAIAVRACIEALDIVFGETPCLRLHTQLPEGNAPARLLARMMGFVVTPPRDSAWRRSGGLGDDAILTKAAWRERRERLGAHKITAAELEPLCPPPPSQPSPQ